MSNKVDITSILNAVTKVERANHTELSGLKSHLANMEATTVDLFRSLQQMDSIDSRFQSINNSFGLDLQSVTFVLEASLLV